MEDFVDKAEELDVGIERGERSGRGKSRGRGRGGRGGRSGGGENREVAISKALSKLLRHAAGEAGVKLDAEGFANLDQVLQWPRIKSLKVTFSEIRTAVSDNTKQRFSMKPDPSLKTPPDLTSEEPSDWVIRANQGHSIAIDSASLLTPITLEADNVPEIVVHGTYFAFYRPILESGGLKKMGRNHIHFSTGLPEDKQGVISGMRGDAEILIYVDVERSLRESDVKWWVSENGVVLTEGDQDGLLNVMFWKKVEGRKENVGVLWEHGKQVAELPENLRSRRAPVGKSQRGGGAARARGRGRGRGRGSESVLEESSIVTNDP